MRPPSTGPLLLLSGVLWLAVPAAAVQPTVTLEIKVVGEAVPRGAQQAVDVFAHIQSGWHVNAHEPNQPYLIPTELTLAVPSGVAAAAVSYPPPEKRAFAFSGGKELLVYGGRLDLATAVTVPERFPGDLILIEAVLRYQACNDTTCLRPTTARAALEVPVVARGAGHISDSGGAAVVPSASLGGEALFRGWLVERGLVFTLLAVAVLGLGLNLTPCVYPLISVTIAYFGGQARGRAQVALLAAVYVLGIALSFSAGGLVAAFSGGLLGAALQGPVVIVFIAGVMGVLAMGNFGLYEFRPPAALMRRAGGAGSGAGGALFMGLTMGVVAAPCVGPVVLGLLIFVGSRQDLYLGFLLFFFLALGMGAPYLVLAIAAGSMKRLPRSGEWLMWTERLFGCVLLSLAAYFAAMLLPLPLGRWLLPAVVGLSGLYMGFIEMAGHSVPYFPLLKRSAGVGMLAFAVWLGQPAASDRAIGWEPAETWSENGGPGDAVKPVLLDFAAEWCIPCREMDHTTYVDSDVVREAERFHMVKADVTEETEATAKLVEEYEVRGVPTVIIFSAVGDESRRLVGYVGAEEMLEAMRAVR